MTEAWSQWEGHVVNSEFHLKKYLGGSDHSAVFLTEDCERGDQPLAIKLIAAPPVHANLQLSRWGLTQRLSHPHLIRLFRKGRCQLGVRDFIFVIMEYAEEDLAQILQERPLTSQEARDMLGPTLDTLAYLHSQGFVHGHLKPANFLAIKDQLKLASDNICGMAENPSNQEKAGPYDPPETGSGARSPHADVWSLGMTLTEVLTQRRPSWNVQETADPLLPPNLPAPFLDIVRGCLRRDPKHRLTIAGISARLFSGSPQQARASELKASPQEPLPTNRPAFPSQKEPAIPRFVFPAVIVLAAVAVTLLAGLGLWHRPQTQPDAPAVRPAQAPDSQKSTADKPSPANPSRQTNPDTDQQPGSAANRLDAAPASLRSEVPRPGSVVHQVLPDVPQTASDTIQGTIKTGVRVKVNAAGDVVAADVDSAGPSRYFARLSLESAQRWRFVPSDQSAGREFILHFEFKNSGVRAYATRAGD